MNGRTVEVELGDTSRPALTVTVNGTAPSQHGRRALSPGTQTTASATITNTGGTAITDVKLTPVAPTGWTTNATTADRFAAIALGQKQTVTRDVTPPPHGGGDKLEWVGCQRHLPHARRCVGLGER
jgi:uncharacterized membrane protein